MKKIFLTVILLQMLTSLPNLYAIENASCSITLKVEKLRNSKGVVNFYLYNRDGTIPDKRFNKYFKKQIGEINNRSAQITFKNLPTGRYAAMILHDENKNGRLDKGFILPIEGIGVTNYSNFGIRHRPRYKKASFELKNNIEKIIKIKYF